MLGYIERPGRFCTPICVPLDRRVSRYLHQQTLLGFHAAFDEISRQSDCRRDVDILGPQR